MFIEDKNTLQKVWIDGEKTIQPLTKEEKRLLKRKKCQWPKCRKRAKFIVEGYQTTNKYFCRKHHEKFTEKVVTQYLNKRLGQVIK